MLRILFFLLLFSLPPFTVAADPADRLVELVNDYRRQAQLPPVALDTQLNRIAERHNRDMAEQGYFAHCSPEGRCLAQRLQARNYQAQIWAETLAAGQATPQEVLQAWHESSSHRKNLLLGDVTHAGISIHRHQDSSIGSPLWTLILTKPQ